MAKRGKGKSAQNVTQICGRIAVLIQQGNSLPTVPGSTMWDPTALAKWYASCAGLCALLTAAIGDSNVWKSTLTSWDPTKSDPATHTAMLGTLEAIQQYLGCP